MLAVQKERPDASAPPADVVLASAYVEFTSIVHGDEPRKALYVSYIFGLLYSSKRPLFAT